MTGPTLPTSLRERRLVQLAPYLPRIGRWAVLPTAAAVAVVLLVAVVTLGATEVVALTELRFAAVLLAGAAAFALDDPAADTLASSPTTLRWRRGTDAVAVAAVVGILWAALLGLTAVLSDEAAAACLAVVRWPLTAELVVLTVTSLVIAVLAARRLGGTAGGAAAAPGVVLAFLLIGGPLGALPGSPLDATWSVVHRRLLLGALALVAALLWGLRDPGQRWPRWRGVLVAALVLGVLAGPLVRARPGDLEARLDAVLAEVVAAQGITGLTVVVDGPEQQWARAVDGGGAVVALPTAELARAVPVGGTSVAEVGATIERGGGVLTGTASPHELTGWARGLQGSAGPFLDRLEAAPPPAGTSWRAPDPRFPPPSSLAEVHVLTGRDTVVLVLTAGAELPPCGLSVADALGLALRA